jgi:VPDSG-CTERM motif
MSRKQLSILVSTLVMCGVTISLATTIDFDSLPDSTDVGMFYHATYGVDFQSAISLTAGFSLNEVDFPPHSGLVAIGDNVAFDGDPMIITFVNPVNTLSAYFAYGSQLTFTAYDSTGTLIGTYVTPTSSHLSSDELISLSFGNISTLDIAGSSANSFIMDDLSFNLASAGRVPDGSSTLFMLLVSLAALFLKWRRAQLDFEKF